MNPAIDAVLQSSGELRKRYRPAIYLETSALCEYWLANLHGDGTRDRAEEALAVGLSRAVPAAARRDAERVQALRAVHERLAGEAGRTRLVLPALSAFEALAGLAGPRETPATAIDPLVFQAQASRQLGSPPLAPLLRADLTGAILGHETLLDEPAALLALGLGAGAVLHLVAARRLGCAAIAAFAAPYRIAAARWSDEGGLPLLATPAALLAAL